MMLNIDRRTIVLVAIAFLAFLLGIGASVLVCSYLPDVFSSEAESLTAVDNLQHIASLIESLVSLITLFGIIWIVYLIRDIPGSLVSFKLPGGAEGKVSISDAGEMIEDRLKDFEPRTQEATLKHFAKQDLTKEKIRSLGLNEKEVSTLSNLGLLEEDLGKIQLTNWGYRVLRALGVETYRPLDERRETST